MRELHLSWASLDAAHPGQAEDIMRVCELLDIPATLIDDRPRRWIGGQMNAARAKEEDRKVMEEPQGKTWQCPRCGNPLDLIAEHPFSQLWECAQCGYSKVVKQ